MSLSAAVSVYIKFFFLLTPFFILAVFLALTEKVETRMQRALAGRVTVGIVLTSILLFLFGETIFDLFGITVDSFRIGAGALLFLSAVSLTQGKFSLPSTDSSLMSLAIVPLAIPITIGPGTVGACRRGIAHLYQEGGDACLHCGGVSYCRTDALCRRPREKRARRERYRDAFQNHGAGARGPQLSADVHRHRRFPEVNRLRSPGAEKAELKFRLLLLLHHVLRIQGSAGPLGDIPRGPDIHAGRVPFREGRRVGCQNGFLCPHQRRIRAGFMIKNVRGRPAKRSLIEMTPHRRGIHDRPPSDIDKHRVSLHQRKLRLSDHSPGSRGERHVY